MARTRSILALVAFTLLPACGSLFGVDFDAARPMDEPPALASGDDAGTNPGIGEDAALMKNAESPDASTSAEARCGATGKGSVLECSTGCPDSLFDKVLLATPLDQPAAYDNDWIGSFAEPLSTPSGLKFGPHPITANWWESYSPTATRLAAFGDVLVCVRLTMTIGSKVGASSFEVSVRGGSEGMVLGYAASRERLSLSTKTTQDAWVEHAATPVALTAGDHEMEFAPYGRGTEFGGELKDANTAHVSALRAVYALPSAGAVAMLGWELASPVVVRRVVIGTPTADAERRILAH